MFLHIGNVVGFLIGCSTKYMRKWTTVIAVIALVPFSPKKLVYIYTSIYIYIFDHIWAYQTKNSIHLSNMKEKPLAQ